MALYLSLAKLDGNHYGSTSGIEPLFKVYYIRRKKINPNDKDTRVDYIDALGDKWQEFKVFHEGFKMWYEINYPEGFKLESLPKEQLDILISQSPYAGCTAEEIDWKGRIQMQAVIQKYITHSISSTINLPTTATTDEVSAIYFAAWRQGLKGITIYREGSRSGVLVSEPTKKQEILEYHDAPKRPKELEADFHTVRAKGESYCIIIGLLNSKPYEVFAFNAAGLESTKGKVIKVAKGRYKYESEDFTLGNLQKMALHTDEMVLTRLISGMMRHGVNPKFIIEQIDKCPLEIVSFGKALARVIKKYIPEKELNERAKCTSCGSTNVRYEEGCAKCLDCGGSKCS
jgi:ribonucleoside-diphosphate reductase alpha chain